MSEYRSAAAMLKDQQRRIEERAGTARQIHGEIAKMLLEDAKELTSGASPSGEERVKLLRDLGGPFGRGPAAYREQAPARRMAPQSDARRVPSKSRLQAAKLRKTLPLRPLGEISGDLERGWRLKKLNTWGSSNRTSRYQLRNRAPYAPFILDPAGTRMAVGRGVTGMRERGEPDGELTRRWRARREGLRRKFAAMPL